MSKVFRLNTGALIHDMHSSVHAEWSPRRKTGGTVSIELLDARRDRWQVEVLDHKAHRIYAGRGLTLRKLNDVLAECGTGLSVEQD